MKLEITKERILAAAAKCSTAKQTLQTLFPEAFEDDKYFYLRGGPVDGLSLFIPNGTSGNSMISIRAYGEYVDKSFYLNTRYNWEIKTDTHDNLCLIPTKK
jgi:hypothetical protein